MPYKKKLIEVALPLEAINKEAAREKSIRHGHPSTLHLWWARRPLAAARAVIWATLVDDPSSLPEQFSTEEEQNAERERLFNILTELVKWENSNNQDVLDKAKAEIMKSTDNNPPPLLDPFAGGGAIPLEAQRLGLEAHASDLNPVAVMINKAMIEIPPKFANQPPINPDAKANPVQKTWIGAQGLAEDVRYYGEWMKQKASEKIGHLYPKVKDKNGRKHTVIAWIWARTVKCPNPACGCEMPLVRSFELSKKNGGYYVQPSVQGKSVSYTVQRGKNITEGTVNRKGATCIACGSPVGFPYIRNAGKEGRIESRLIAVVANGDNGRLYLPADETHLIASQINKPDNYPDADLPNNPRDFKTPNYGLTKFASLFTARQLTTLTTFSALVSEAQKQVIIDGGTDAYAQAIAVYLSFIVSKQADRGSSICSWDISRDGLRNTFGRQAIPMVWDFAEGNPFSSSSGSYGNMLDWVVECIEYLPADGTGKAIQHNAQTDVGLRNIVVSTDPPYYDNIGYADLSDFFYIWLRQTLMSAFPDIFRTMLVPKAEELVATPYRFDGSKESANSFFEDGMLKVFTQIYEYTCTDIPVTVYYAYKQSEDSGTGTSSTGWETMLSAIIQAGFTITGTWPIRTELSNRIIGIDSNALATSVVLVCRKRSHDAPSTNRRQFTSELREALKQELHLLQTSNISPVDFPQASLGPGMEVFSKYSEVLEADGTPMSIRDALVLINQELYTYLNTQAGRMDSDSQFCIAWYELFGLATGNYGDAENMARARLSNLQELVDDGVLESGHGKVRLKRRDELPEKWDSGSETTVWTMVQQLCRYYETLGLNKTAEHMLALSTLDVTKLENVKDLTYHAYVIAEKEGWTDDALAYNSLVTAWSDLTERMAKLKEEKPEQMRMYDV